MTLDDLPLARDVSTVTAAQMAEVDRFTIEEQHIGVDLLMENASRQIAAAARALLGGRVAGKSVVGLVGSGNNGGDTAGALRHLINWGARVRVELAAPQERLRRTTQMQVMRILMSTDAQVAVVRDATMHEDEFDGPRALASDLLLDGLLGYGSNGAPRGTVAELIAAANASGVLLLAVDLPSGLDPDTGARPGVAVRAAATVTLALPKTGLRAPEAADAVGRLLLADIGIPPSAFARIGVDTRELFVDGDLLRVAG